MIKISTTLKFAALASVLVLAACTEKPEAVETAPPPSVTVAPKAPPAPPAAAAPPAAPTQLESIQRTHTLPPYPTISQRLGEQGTTQMEVAISTELGAW